MTDRYNLHLFYSGEASVVKCAHFSRPNADVFKIENLAIDPIPTGESKKSKNSVESEWAETLPKLRNVKALSATGFTQQLFDSICQVPNLEQLFIFSSKTQNISGIANLTSLRRLQISRLTQLTDISPIVSLENLELLSFENCFKVVNYEVLGKMHGLVGLELCGDTFAPKRLQLKSLQSFVNLKKLRHLDMSSAAVIDKSYECILEMENLERLDLLVKMPKDKREEIKLSHKNLKAGFFVDYDFEKNEFYEGKEW